MRIREMEAMPDEELAKYFNNGKGPTVAADAERYARNYTCYSSNPASLDLNCHFECCGLAELHGINRRSPTDWESAVELGTQALESVWVQYFLDRREFGTGVMTERLRPGMPTAEAHAKRRPALIPALRRVVLTNGLGKFTYADGINRNPNSGSFLLTAVFQPNRARFKAWGAARPYCAARRKLASRW